MSGSGVWQTVGGEQIDIRKIPDGQLVRIRNFLASRVASMDVELRRRGIPIPSSDKVTEKQRKRARKTKPGPKSRFLVLDMDMEV